MNKKPIIITILLALVAVTGQAQIHYRLEGTIGDSTLNTRLQLNQGISAMKWVNATIDTLEVEGGKLIPTEGTLEEPASFDLKSVTNGDEKLSPISWASSIPCCMAIPSVSSGSTV